ncbi:fibronectin type III domain-containing protein [Bacillus wiedmannii]|uniref:fibronectin type III domain-containing protein n=1 Tax=Bacillus wiedmannii TaxID=1890302 RepID=UPI0020CD8FF8|nr:fibronectin type III domain-containing protein [Bacillus wiedmannii]MCP9282333.1 fibronectin type III domain-containing protein [Bacillus wiedmannii]
MQFKRYFVVVVIFFSFMVGVHETYAKNTNVLLGKRGYTDFDFSNHYDYEKKDISMTTDGNESSANRFLGRDKKYSTIYYDLGEEHDLINYSVIFRNQSTLPDYLHIRFYDKDKKLINTISKSHERDELTKFKDSIDVKNVRYASVQFDGASNGIAYLYEFELYDNNVFAKPIQNAELKPSYNAVDLTWDVPDDPDLEKIKIYNDKSLLVSLPKDATGYKVLGLEPNTNYNFKIFTVSTQGKETVVDKAVKTLQDPTKIPPGSPSSLVTEATSSSIKLKWKKPVDDDLEGFKIAVNGKNFAEIGIQEEFEIKGLEPETEYYVSVFAVDKDKNVSIPVNTYVKTLEEKDDIPPHVPSNLLAKPSNGALIASWDKVSDKDLAGYNVYADDKKVNSNLISSTNFTIKNLENNRKYKIQVQAVDRSGNASTLSLAAYGIPDEKTLPIIESKYSLQDVSDGVSVMFGQFWTVLAFAVGIPLAFYIIHKLKHTVLP